MQELSKRKPNKSTIGEYFPFWMPGGKKKARPHALS